MLFMQYACQTLEALPRTDGGIGSPYSTVLTIWTPQYCTYYLKVLTNYLDSLTFYPPILVRYE